MQLHRAFSEVVRKYRVPLELPAALIEGFEWDVEGRRYETLSDTYAYCTRVAGTVGVMMSMLMGVRNTDVLSRACDLGVAMQLTNIARDVGEDARNGRVYLPLALLRENGVDVDAWMSDPRPCDGIEKTLREILAIADTHYQRSEWGISHLPISVRPSIFAAQNYNNFSCRRDLCLTKCLCNDVYKTRCRYSGGFSGFSL